MKSKIGLFFVVLTVLFLLVIFVFPDDKWQDTPQKALSICADAPMEEEGVLEIEQLLDIFYFEDTVTMLYISKAKTLVACTFWRNDKGKFALAGYSNEDSLDDPHYFVISDEMDQLIGQVCIPLIDEKIVYGFKYSSVQVWVNDAPVQAKTYTFNLQGKDWSIDYWWAENVEFDENGNCNVTKDSDTQAQSS